MIDDITLDWDKCIDRCNALCPRKYTRELKDGVDSPTLDKDMGYASETRMSSQLQRHEELQRTRTS